MDEKVKVSDMIAYNSKAYCEEIIKNLFPSPIDGLISARRRILQTQDHTKSRIAAAEVIGRTKILHNHNDASIYSTLNHMCDTFRCAVPLFVIIGSGNSYFNEEAAASRYTEFSVSEQAKDLFIRGLDRATFPTKVSGDLTTRELVSYVPKLPMALLIPTNTIGYGFSSKTLPLGISQTCDLVLHYLTHKAILGDCDYSKVLNLFVPVLPIDCRICNRLELLQEYRKGNFSTPVETEGHYMINSSKVVLIRTISYGESSTSVFSGFITAMGDKNHWVSKEDLRVFTTSVDAEYCDLEIILTKMKSNIFEVISKLSKLLHIRRKAHPQSNYVLDNNMVNLSYPEIIKMWYQERYKSIMNAKRHTQQKLHLTLSELEVYMLVCDRKDEVISIMKTVTSRDDGLKKFRAAFGFTYRQGEILAKANLRTLSAYKAEDIRVKMRSVKLEMDALVKSFHDIDAEIAADVKMIRKKYSNRQEYSSREYRWKGVVYIHDMGMAMFEDEKEMFRLAEVFKSKTKSVYMFGNSRKVLIKATTGRVVANVNSVAQLSATYHATSIELFPSGKTLMALEDGKWRNKFSQTAQMTYVSKNPLAITTKGIERVKLSDVLSCRKHKSEYLFLFDGDISDTFVITSMSSSSWTDIHTQCRSKGDTLHFDTSGKVFVIQVVASSVVELQPIVNLPMHPSLNAVQLPVVKLSRNKINFAKLRYIKYKL